jgi:hypothetical protein
METWSSRVAFLLTTALVCLGQNANVSVSANSGLAYDRRPFGKYLLEACSLSGVELTLRCNKVPYPPHESLEIPKHPCPKEKVKPCEVDIAVQKKDQNITIKLVCDPAQKDPCDLADPKVGKDFYVSSTADSGLPVKQTLLLGNATPIGGYQTVHYRANAIGPIVIRATAPEVRCRPSQETQACDYAAAPPVDLILQVSGDPAGKSESCTVLPASGGSSQSKPLDASTIVSLLGSPTPFILSPEGANTIFIYATRLPLRGDEPNILGSFQQAIAQLAGRTVASLGITSSPAKPFTVELKIPHASALGDLATRIGGLNYSQFTVQDVGRGSVRITAPTQPDCGTWTAFLTDIRQMAWQIVPSSMSTKLDYLSSSDVATAFSSLTSSASTPTASSPSSSSANSSASTSSNAPAAPGSSSSSATIAVTQPPGSNIQISSDTTPCIVAGLALGSNTACGSSPSSGSAAGSAFATSAGSAAASTGTGSLSMGSVAVAAGTGEQSPPDLLVYSDTNPGDDAQIVERNRVLAQLDLPRPEMILTAWVTQNSTTSPQAIGAFKNLVRRIVSDYNDEYEKVMLRAWFSLKQQQSIEHTEDNDYFNEPFRSYIADRFIADTNQPKKQGSSSQDLSQAFLDQSQAKMANPVPPMKRTSLGICETGRYCLGYLNLFRRGIFSPTSELEAENPSPIRPTLTDLLLAIIAAQDPIGVTNRTIDDVEAYEPARQDVKSQRDSKAVRPNKNAVPTEAGEDYCDNGPWLKHMVDYSGPEMIETRKRCHAIWQNLDLDHASPPPQPPNCTDLDFRGTLGTLLNASPQPSFTGTREALHEPRVYLECFRRVAQTLLAAQCAESDTSCGASQLKLLLPRIKIGTKINTDTKAIEIESITSVDNVNSPENARPFGVGLFRAAIADFLFNYKMSQQYPHEFVPYDLTQSANNLNSALSPLIDAFNHDLWAYQMFMRADMQYQVGKLNSRWDQRCCAKRLFGLDKPSFFNDGLVTVRTISGQPTSVNATSQSFLNASRAPELSALLSSLSGSSGSAAGSAGGGTGTAGASGSSASSPPVLGGNFALIASALANYQTSFAQIGRQLSFTATPRTLASASSAEITVTLNADESAGPPLYTGPGANDPAFNTSRVANHDTSTRVRVDSIKLFEVSSFSAIVQRSRSRFPLLPPFVEIPYIGTLVGIPLGAAKEFHSSTAVISAYVVPTAADIAYGLRFVFDLVVDGPKGPCSFYKGASGPDVPNVCVFRHLFSWRDLPTQPLREFNRNITHCFATDTTRDGCFKRASFDNSLQTQ